jgi:hypothetical protein
VFGYRDPNLQEKVRKIKTLNSGIQKMGGLGPVLSVEHK